MKRVVDVLISTLILVLISPVLILISVAIYAYDRHSPFYIAPRVGKDGSLFSMVKFRSMVVDADKTGVTSTSAADRRITPVGHIVRRYKLDELIQLWNVLRGDMSLVGPRPNVPSGIAVYTKLEMSLLTVRPGITDFASIIFADEGDILKDYPNADLAYDQLIRPWKSRLGLFYVNNCSVWLDLKLVWFTVVALISRDAALRAVHKELVRLDAPAELVRVALRISPLQPGLPPGETALNSNA